MYEPAASGLPHSMQAQTSRPPSSEIPHGNRDNPPNAHAQVRTPLPARLPALAAPSLLRIVHVLPCICPAANDLPPTYSPSITLRNDISAVRIRVLMVP